MSTAAFHRVRFGLGARVAAIGSLVLTLITCLTALDWVARERAALALVPDREALAVDQAVRSALAEKWQGGVPELDVAAAAIASAMATDLALREQFKRVRKQTNPPDLRAAAIAELARAGMDGAWVREARAPVTWLPGTRAFDERHLPPTGPCIVQLSGGALGIARCEEVRLAFADRVLHLGGLRIVDLAGLPGPSRLVVPLGQGQSAVLVASEGFAGLVAGGAQVAQGALGLPAGVVLEVAVPQAVALEWTELLALRAGPSTGAWTTFVRRTLLALAAGVGGFVLLGAWIAHGLAPLVALSRRLSMGDLGARLASDRGDEIGLLSATLSDLGRSLNASRSAGQRAARSEALAEAARGVAHEIRNPLLPIRATVENLVRWKREEPQRFEDSFDSRMAAVLTEVDQLARLARELSEASSAGRPERRLVDVAGLVSEVAALHAGHDEAISIQAVTAPALPGVPLDPGQVRQVLTNLVRNALEALAGRGGRIVLSVAAGHEEDVVLAVDDDGPGVPEDDLERLFERRYTTRQASGGSGLGLWLSRRMVEAHGGTLSASRSDLGGLRVEARLPRRVPTG